ncbi:hypothetical protein DXN04_15385 [Chitinophaga silvisoli]|uniref:Uncharacterized protein n=1 Tax=Chitinophaga silvisoli TaxID=2291814 RepID=A0A3E1P363_9BACT|nr:hypothetical protein DXN04_15385 [Chitinophaga silvisoli]
MGGHGVGMIPFLVASFLMPFSCLEGFRRLEIAIGLGIDITRAALILSITALLWFDRKSIIRNN